jgi:WD40 repeat protein
VRIWDAVSGRELTRLAHESIVSAVAFSPDAAWLVTGCYDEAAHVWDMATGREIARLNHPYAVLSVAVSRDGVQIATGCSEVQSVGWRKKWRAVGYACVWDAG